jgi:hypothetical protein
MILEKTFEVRIVLLPEIYCDPILIFYFPRAILPGKCLRDICFINQILAVCYT